MIIEYQEQQEIAQESEEVAAHNIATVGEVTADGITLIFPGETEASEKKYAYNKSVTFAAGDKVYIVKISGTYLVVCKYEGTVASSGEFESLKISDANGYWIIYGNEILPSKATGFNIGLKTLPVDKIYANEIYLDGTKLTTGGDSGATSGTLTSLKVGGSTYYWTITETAILPSRDSLSYFNIGSATYPVQKIYAKEIYLNGTKLTTGSSSGTTDTDFIGKTVKMGGSSNGYIEINDSRHLRPSTTLSSYACYLGTSSYYWHYAYIGSDTVSIGSKSTSKLGFFGKTPTTQQSVAASATVATLITALKAYGLIA